LAKKKQGPSRTKWRSKFKVKIQKISQIQPSHFW